MKSTNTKFNKMRKQNGSFMVGTLLMATMVLLPLSIAGFEFSRVHLMQRQLRASTDAAALGAATAYSGDSKDEKLASAKKAALEIFKRNVTCSGELGSTTLVPSIKGVSPSARQCMLEVEYDEPNNQFLAKAAFGYVPAFGAFLNWATQPVVSVSKASGAAHKRDIVIVFDTSGSMEAAGNGEPMQSAKSALREFLKKLHDSGEVHFGVVTFALHASGKKNAPASQRGVDLNKDTEQYLQASDVINSATASGSTNTHGGLKEAVKMLQGSAHRDDADPIIVLVSDGMPNHYYQPANGDEEPVGDEPTARVKAIEVAAQAGKKKITVHSLGFFHVPGTAAAGTQFMKGLKQAAGGDSQAYLATNINEFHQCLDEICNQALGLVN